MSSWRAFCQNRRQGFWSQPSRRLYFHHCRSWRRCAEKVAPGRWKVSRRPDFRISPSQTFRLRESRKRRFGTASLTPCRRDLQDSANIDDAHGDAGLRAHGSRGRRGGRFPKCRPTKLAGPRESRERRIAAVRLTPPADSTFRTQPTSTTAASTTATGHEVARG